MALQRRALVALTEDLGSVSSTPMVAHTCLLNLPFSSMDTVVAHTRMHAKHSRIIKMLKRKGNSSEPIIFRPDKVSGFVPVAYPADGAQNGFWYVTGLLNSSYQHSAPLVN